MKEVVILGSGTAGTMMANKLSRTLSPKQWQVTVIDENDHHIYQPGLLFVPFGSYRVQDIVRPRSAFLNPAVRVLLSGFESVDADSQSVQLRDGQILHYDVLIIATGCDVDPGQTPGLSAEGWLRDAFDFYTLRGAEALAARLSSFERGTLLLNVAEMPIKCPVAPLEFMFLADAYFQQRGLRDAVDLVYATPLDGAFTKPRASALLGDMLDKRGIRVVSEFTVESVDGAKREARSYDGRTLDYDLLVSVPIHVGSSELKRSGLTDDLGFVPTDKHTLQTKAHPNIFALGDATDLPSSKAGSVAHFQAEVLLDNILRFIADQPLDAQFDGHSNCFIETGHGKAMLIDFNYETEPLPGRFPLPVLGPFSLLQESAINHWGKLAFKWAYWNKLLPGDELPLDHRMLMAGKQLDQLRREP